MKLKYTWFQKIIEIITITFMLSIWGYLILSWGDIPDKIPGHYNAAGVVDRWGSKGEILAMPIVMVILYALLSIIAFFPSIWNAPVKITEENKEFVYSNLKSMLILMKMELIIAFSYISYCNIRVRELGIWFLPLELIIVFGTIIYYLVKIMRKNKDLSGGF